MMEAVVRPQKLRRLLEKRFDYLALAPAAAAICYPFLLNAFHAIVGTQAVSSPPLAIASAAFIMVLAFPGFHLRTHDVYCVCAVSFSARDHHPIAQVSERDIYGITLFHGRQPIRRIDERAGQCDTVKLDVVDPHVFDFGIIVVARAVRERKFDHGHVEGGDDSPAFPGKFPPEIFEGGSRGCVGLLHFRGIAFEKEYLLAHGVDFEEVVFWVVFCAGCAGVFM